MFAHSMAAPKVLGEDKSIERPLVVIDLAQIGTVGNYVHPAL
jgi:hypothetical protein